MKHLQFILFVFMSSMLWGQNDTVFYFGVNGKIGQVDNSKIKKEIKFRSDNRVRVRTSRWDDGEWVRAFTEKIKIEKPSVFSVTVRGKTFSREKLKRTFLPQNDSLFKFTDWQEGQIKREGFTLSKLPLILHGTVTEFYPNGNKKSVSEYTENELVSNRNWKENGVGYIDNIYYSVDTEPRFSLGMPYLHDHILTTFKKSEVDISEVEGRIVIGFVVMENGEIDGIRIEGGMTLELNNLALQAFHALPGKWVPAQLNGQPVRYYQLFPINFIYRYFDFDYLELKGSMLYWEIN